ncbi:MAG: hypothetical protein RPT10_09260, partial [SAR324 cluster bacterium]
CYLVVFSIIRFARTHNRPVRGSSPCWPTNKYIDSPSDIFRISIVSVYLTTIPVSPLYSTLLFTHSS